MNIEEVKDHLVRALVDLSKVSRVLDTFDDQNMTTPWWEAAGMAPEVAEAHIDHVLAICKQELMKPGASFTFNQNRPIMRSYESGSDCCWVNLLGVQYMTLSISAPCPRGPITTEEKV